MSEKLLLEDYKNFIKRFYDNHSLTTEEAKATIHPKFDEATTEPIKTAGYCLRQYYNRFGSIDNIRVFDWGCGIGRIIKGFLEFGIKVDGMDVSHNMIEECIKIFPSHHFNVCNVAGCSSTPEGSYDLVYSFLVLQHNCNRYLRLRNIENMANLLNDRGMAIIQLLYQPNSNSIVDKRGVDWTSNKTSNWTNSDDDCVITLDNLSEVYRDFSMFFHELNFQFMEDPQKNQAENFTRNHVIISGTKKPQIFDKLYDQL